MPLKQTYLYREGRYIWRSFFLYKKPLQYLWCRFVIGPRIRRVKRALDRPVETADYSLHVLCSHKDITMLLWMLASWYKVLPKGMAAQVYIHEDGSFQKEDYTIIKSLLPAALIVGALESDEQVRSWLKDYPVTCELRMRADVPLMKKLVDPLFTGSASYKLILDTDMLWFSEPLALLDCIKRRETCATLSNTPMKGEVAQHLTNEKRLLNSGLVGYTKNDFSLSAVEKFFAGLGTYFFKHHAEQAGYAHALASPTFLPFERYSLKPYDALVMRHYTGPVREKFWFEGISKISGEFL